MPYRHLPNSHAQRLTAMQAAAEKWLATADPAQRLITHEHFAAIALAQQAARSDARSQPAVADLVSR